VDNPTPWPPKGMGCERAAKPPAHTPLSHLKGDGGMRGAIPKSHPKNCRAGFPACLDSLERLSYTFFG